MRTDTVTGELKQSILTVLADKEMVTIMNSSILHPRSIVDIIRETGLPHTTTYRKIKWMISHGILTVEKIVVSKDGKKFSLIRSIFKSIEVRYEYQDVSIQVDRNVDTISKITQRIFSLEGF